MSSEIVPSPKKELPKLKKSFVDVQLDGVLKETVELEEHCRKTWEEKWDFFKNFDKTCYERAERLFGLSEQEFREMVHRKRCREKGRKTDPVRRFYAPTPSGDFPRTSSGEVGWKSAKSEYRLEMFGKLYTSPKLTIRPQDDEHYPPEHQKCIILG